MKKSTLFVLWGGMFILCAGLGFIPEPTGVLRWMMTGLSLLFFLPPALTVYQCQKEKDGKLLRLVRTVSLVVLIATVALLVVNLLSIALLLVMPEKTALIVGDVLYYALILVSTPMICGQYWGIGLIGWAALLWSSIFAEKSLKGK